jgi:hypothetical protein
MILSSPEKLRIDKIKNKNIKKKKKKKKIRIIIVLATMIEMLLSRSSVLNEAEN